ncbi:MAG TPA: HEAT repeat domain-containing protein [Gemmatimonadaceae bacterium]
MTRTELTIGVAALVALAAPVTPAGAQSLAERVRAVSGEAEVRFASRPDVCGDGEGWAWHHDDFTMGDATIHGSHGEWLRRCVHGPVRVRVSVTDHRVTRLHTHVGGETERGVTDLGTVSTSEATDWLLALARTAPEDVAREAVAPAALADSVTISPSLLALARDRERPLRVRKPALFWAGQVGEPGVLEPVRAIAADRSEDASLREHALFVLSQFPDGAGVPALIDATRDGSEPSIARKATFWLGQADDPRASAALRELVLNAGADEEVRAQAVFVLGQHGNRPEDIAFLREHFASLPARLQDRALMGIAQNGGAEAARWLAGLITDESRDLHVRKQALFWAGQGDDISTGAIGDLYAKLRDPEMKKQAIFVLSQRDDSAATTKLIDIARTDPDHEMRKRAMFWLGQKHDPRAAEFLGSLLER